MGADVYKTTSGATSDAWELGIGRALWSAVLTRPWPMQAMSATISSAAEGHHLQVWSPDAAAEATLQALGVGGAVTFPDDGAPLVTVNGYTDNRAGYFVTTHTSVKREGRLVTATVTFTSTAPSGPPSILLGMTRGDTAGQAARHVRTRGDALPAAGLATGEGHGRRRAELSVRGTAVRTADDHGSAAGEPGATSTVVFRYRLPTS